MKKLSTWLPFIIGLALGAGVLIGTKLGSRSMFRDSSGSYEKIKAVLGYVEANYVDTVNPEQLTDLTLVNMLQHLDPHSDYFTAEQTKAMSEPLQGNFEGVGIEYNFIRDTLVVMAVIRNGPSEKAGLKTGDKIIKANDTLIVGKNANEKFIKGKLRGGKGTQVKVSVVRYGKKEPFDIMVTRGNVPIYSITAAYMIDRESGYIKLDRFAETSYDEFMKAAKNLLGKGMKKMVLDLRGNGGGYLDAATDIADEFLAEGKLIVYTKGRVEGEQRTYATNTKNTLENIPLTILVDENSASASEILSGAIQDNDRGTIIGRRTFGKGLVQEEKVLNDGSAFRLTIARYYTPTGRSIQKPYNKGLEEYEADELNRYNHGELINADSIHFPDSLKYKTPGGKTVYGGGGIMPDIFVPLDTSGGTNLLTDLYRKDIFTIWALGYAEQHAEWKSNGVEKFSADFSVSGKNIAEMILLADQNGIKNNDVQLDRSLPLVKKYMKAALARIYFGDAAYLQVWNENDPFISAATGRK